MEVGGVSGALFVGNCFLLFLPRVYLFMSTSMIIIYLSFPHLFFHFAVYPLFLIFPFFFFFLPLGAPASPFNPSIYTSSREDMMG